MNDRTVHRSIRERWVIEGTLVLETPAHFGNGDSDPLTDMPLLFDEATGKPLLPGTSIAGALRNYLRELELNYGVDFPSKENEEAVSKERSLYATKLFGGFRGDEDGEQSPLIVNDAIGYVKGIELRDGVKISAETRTAEDQEKFDIQLLAAGTTFDLRFELLISDKEKETDKLKTALATVLMGLTNRQITLGARKRRGFGQCTVENWNVHVYNPMTPSGLKAWLASETKWANEYPLPNQPQIDLAVLVDTKDNRETAHLMANFTIDGTLLIRSGFGESDQGPDTVHLHSRRNDKDKPVPVIPGTSWAGILRHRALKIARTVSNDDEQKSKKLIEGMFGPSEIKKGNKDTKASRISIKESEIELHEVEPLVITRTKIDRFTGGAYEGALFSEQPVIGKPGKENVELQLTLRQPTNAEIGLLLLLLKDLWTGDLPIGGASGVGRGRLKGIYAKLQTDGKEWEFNVKGQDGVDVSPESKTLQEKYVDVFNAEMKGQGAA